MLNRQVCTDSSAGQPYLTKELVSLEITILTLVLAGICDMVVYTFVTGISPVPTAPRVQTKMLDALPAAVEGTIFELGSGWGTLAVALAKCYPNCRVEAYELSTVPWLFSRAWSFLSRTPNLTIHRANFHGASLRTAAVVVCYLYPGGMKRLRPKLEQELPAGALVISNTFAVPNWEPEVRYVVNDLHNSPVLVYRMPQPGQAGGSRAGDEIRTDRQHEES